MGSEPRILHIEISGGFGGIEMFLLSVYRNINRLELQFDFVSSREEIAVEDQLKQLGGRVFRIKYGKAFDYYRELTQLIRENNYRVVHIHKNSAANIIPFLACKKAGVETVIAHSHNTSPSRGRVTKVLHYMNRPILNALSNEKFACSDLAAVWLFGKWYTDKNVVTCIKNGIEIERFIYNAGARMRVREELGLHEGTLLLGNVGRISRQKNQTFLVDILAEVKKLHGDTKLLICGDGDMKSEVLQRAGKLGVGDSLILPGACSNVNEMLQAMDVFVMPSLYEGLAVAAVEAQCAGLPVVLSDSMSRETRILESCRIVSLGSPAEKWAEHIMELKDIIREDASRSIREAGFDVRNTANYLQKFYLAKKD